MKEYKRKKKKLSLKTKNKMGQIDYVGQKHLMNFGGVSSIGRKK